MKPYYWVLVATLAFLGTGCRKSPQAPHLLRPAYPAVFFTARAGALHVVSARQGAPDPTRVAFGGLGRLAGTQKNLDPVETAVHPEQLLGSRYIDRNHPEFWLAAMAPTMKNFVSAGPRKPIRLPFSQ